MRALIQGSSHQIPLSDKTFHCCVTSPPYYWVRKYEGGQQVTFPEMGYKPSPISSSIYIPSWTGSLGHEPVPEYFIGHLISIFREVYRVMRDDSVTWIVIADSFWDTNKRRHISKVRDPLPGEEEGQLIGIPNMLFLALKADGWIVRNDLVYAKKAPMPESVRGWTWQRCRVKVAIGDEASIANRTEMMGIDRHRLPGLAGNTTTWQPCPGCAKCEDHGGYVLRRGSWRHTRAHEVVLMCVKSMGYWSDQEVVREVAAKGDANAGARNYRTWSDSGRERAGQGDDKRAAGRNPRSVVTPKPESYSGAHYAAYPTSLIAPLIRATCPARCCPVCGAGWSPVVKHTLSNTKGWGRATKDHTGDLQGSNATIRNEQGRCGDLQANVLGYRPSCDCQPTLETGEVEVPFGPNETAGTWAPAPIPGIVFDPFLGSGTTLQVAKDLMLRGVGLDLAHQYLDEQAKVRAAVGAPSATLDGLPMFANLALDKSEQDSV